MMYAQDRKEHDRNPDAEIFYSAEEQQNIVTNIVEPAPFPGCLYQALELDKWFNCLLDFCTSK
jgi:hypothetical protein